jgi:predicted phage-related endonuclease
MLDHAVKSAEDSIEKSHQIIGRRVTRKRGETRKVREKHRRLFISIGNDGGVLLLEPIGNAARQNIR